MYKNSQNPTKRLWITYVIFFWMFSFQLLTSFFFFASFCCFYWSLLLRAHIKQKVFGIFLEVFCTYPGCSYPVVLADFEPFTFLVCATDGKQAVCWADMQLPAQQVCFLTDLPACPDVSVHLLRVGFLWKDWKWSEVAEQWEPSLRLNPIFGFRYPKQKWD